MKKKLSTKVSYEKFKHEKTMKMNKGRPSKNIKFPISSQAENWEFLLNLYNELRGEADFSLNQIRFNINYEDPVFVD
eukprot:snap_masked-scaffold_57-processed-gene-0.17-mRNA-1 protein AED:1.00 eAED:1.00 QI:0/-1/0/0/-1/1/1/0/76